MNNVFSNFLWSSTVSTSEVLSSFEVRVAESISWVYSEFGFDYYFPIVMQIMKFYVASNGARFHWTTALMY